MRRRELLLMAIAMMAAPGGLRAQQKAMPVIGFLSGGSAPSSPDPFLGRAPAGIERDRLGRREKPGDGIPCGGGPL